ncbi:hypothetical protein L211DRAFT_835843 [Terfezia boudieri ATCC MYA-4762]|uniref:Uncharacterized protein n=1 Tax=Terfezia boudieri ATCC MYA-4762 TaxID=1051890 RepID=A0A3N4LW31_9PEZI|nr:hypothetical protein L211DRAFT_835843 [Terfezia boudieri ATCC MYA-4762]
MVPPDQARLQTSECELSCEVDQSQITHIQPPILSAASSNGNTNPKWCAQQNWWQSKACGRRKG